MALYKSQKGRYLEDSIKEDSAEIGTSKPPLLLICLERPLLGLP